MVRLYSDTLYYSWLYMNLDLDQFLGALPPCLALSHSLFDFIRFKIDSSFFFSFLVCFFS